MKLKLARTTLKAKPKTIELKKLEEELANKSIFYFDKDNSHKELKELIEHFEEKGFSNLWGFWSDKWVVDHGTFSTLEWTIAAVFGFVIMQLVNKYWSPFVARAFKLENTA